MNSRFLNNLSCLYQFAEKDKCSRSSMELISWGPHSSLERERKSRVCLFTSCIKRKIRHFHVVVVQSRQRNVRKRVMHVQSCYFAHNNGAAMKGFFVYEKPRIPHFTQQTSQIATLTRHIHKTSKLPR